MLYEELMKHYDLFFKTNHDLNDVLLKLQNFLPLVKDDKDLLKKYADIYLRVSTARRIICDASKDFGDLYKAEGEKCRASISSGESMEDITKELEEFFESNIA